MSDGAQTLFRGEAVEHHAGGHGDRGHALRIHPRWTTWVYWVVTMCVAGLLIFLAVVRVNEYSRGPAIVQAGGRTVLTATAAGTVVGVNAEPGQVIAAGDVLVRLDDAREVAELDRIDRETALHTRNILMDLADEDARRALTRLRADRALAEAALEARHLRAPHDGTVRDIRIRLSQYVTPGQVLLSVLQTEAGFHVVALLPGETRPLIRPGGPLRLELAGYPYSYQKLTIESIGDQVVGPEEVRRYLGPVVADTVRLAGPVVLVRATLPSDTFSADHRTYDYFDGMIGIAEARVRTENIAVSLIPGLKSLLRETHE